LYEHAPHLIYLFDRSSLYSILAEGVLA